MIFWEPLWWWNTIIQDINSRTASAMLFSNGFYVAPPGVCQVRTPRGWRGTERYQPMQTIEPPLHHTQQLPWILEYDGSPEATSVYHHHHHQESIVPTLEWWQSLVEAYVEDSPLKLFDRTTKGSPVEIHMENQ